MNTSHAALSGLGLAAVLPRPAAGAVPSNEQKVRRCRPVALLAEVALTVGALLGVAVTGVTVVAVRSGLKPLVVRSGSMEPTIPTGAMVLVRKIDASAIRVDDVVAVERPDRTRVTHRVVAVEHRGPVAELTMKGDANEDPDPVPVSVRHAYRLAWQVPMLGKTVAWLATAQGGFVMGCVATVFLRRAAGRRAPGERRVGSRCRVAQRG